MPWPFTCSWWVWQKSGSTGPSPVASLWHLAAFLSSCVANQKEWCVLLLLINPLCLPRLDAELSKNKGRNCVFDLWNTIWKHLKRDIFRWLAMFPSQLGEKYHLWLLKIAWGACTFHWKWLNAFIFWRGNFGVFLRFFSGQPGLSEYMRYSNVTCSRTGL